MQREIKKVAIWIAMSKKRANEFLEVLKRSLEIEGIEVVLENQADLIIVLSGDGGMLACVNENYSLEKPFLGLNFGGRGFLLNDFREDVVDLIVQRRFRVYEFPLLHVKAFKSDGSFAENISLNDICVERDTPQCCRFRIFINGKLAGNRIEGDGILVSTALGSAAYNLSSGGSAVHPLAPVICISPLYETWPKRFPHLVFPWDSEIKIEVHNPTTRSVRVGCGKTFFYENITEAVIRKSDYGFSLVMLEGEDFDRRLFSRIMRVKKQKGGRE